MIGLTMLAGPIIFAIGLTASAQTNDDPARPVLGQTGKVFTLQYVPKTKRITVSLVGQPVATAGPDRIQIFGRQFPAGTSTEKPLTISSTQNSFEILDPIDPKTPIEIEIHDRKTHQKEKFRLNQKPPP